MKVIMMRLSNTIFTRSIKSRFKQVLGLVEGEVFEISVRPEGSPKGDGRTAQGGLRHRAIAPHERRRCAPHTDEQGAIGSSTLPPRSWRMRQAERPMIKAAAPPQNKLAKPDGFLLPFVFERQRKVCDRFKNIF